MNLLRYGSFLNSVLGLGVFWETFGSFGRRKTSFGSFGRLQGTCFSQRRNFTSRRWYKKVSRETPRKLEYHDFDAISSKKASLLAESVEEDFEGSFKTLAIWRGLRLAETAQEGFEGSF